MIKLNVSLILCLAVGVATTGCNPNATGPDTSTSGDTPSTQVRANATNPEGGFAGTVMETINSGGYTYVQVDVGGEKHWAAAPEFTVSVGDTVKVPPGMPMKDFHSSTLDRDFDVVYFVNGISAGGSAGASASGLPAGHPPVEGMDSSAAPDVAVERIEGGQTVEEIFGQKAELKGKTIKVRGKVVKFNRQIMGKNWVHLRDGTGSAGTDDLTATTSAEVKVGDTVVASGTLAVDQDFGYSYQYPVLLQDAEITVE